MLLSFNQSVSTGPALDWTVLTCPLCSQSGLNRSVASGAGEQAEQALIVWLSVPAVCVYQGVPYRQGQTWNDGCDKVCRCEDGMTGRINCDDR